MTPEIMPMRTGEGLKSLPRRTVVYDEPSLLDSALFWVAVSCAAAVCVWLIVRIGDHP